MSDAVDVGSLDRRIDPWVDPTGDLVQPGGQVGRSWQGSEEILAEAARIVTCDRNVANGEPEDNFFYIAKAWTASLQARGLVPRDRELTEADVARMMVVFKMMRDSHAPHRDNRTDAVGYTLCLERVEPSD